MTGTEFMEWCTAHGCTVEPTDLSMGGNPKIKIHSKKFGKTTYLFAPFDSELPDDLVERRCAVIGVPIPDKRLLKYDRQKRD